MPSYRTHSLHGEIVSKKANYRININREDIKLFCMGPDILLLSDHKIFNFQHANNVKDYFEYLLKYIKENHLQNNSEVMAFLYGQLDHYIVDVITHPFIYYYTKFVKNSYKCDLHALVEMWLDDYILDLYRTKKQEYYEKKQIISKELLKLIDDVYLKLFERNNESKKYQVGLKYIIKFDELIRNKRMLTQKLISIMNIGDILYTGNHEKLLPYLNKGHKKWYNPETNEEYDDSFEDLWDKSIEESLKMIDDINAYLYDDKPLNNNYINNDISYNTGIPCNQGQNYQYAKKKNK